MSKTLEELVKISGSNRLLNFWYRNGKGEIARYRGFITEWDTQKRIANWLAGKYEPKEGEAAALAEIIKLSSPTPESTSQRKGTFVRIAEGITQNTTTGKIYLSACICYKSSTTGETIEPTMTPAQVLAENIGSWIYAFRVFSVVEGQLVIIPWHAWPETILSSISGLHSSGETL